MPLSDQAFRRSLTDRLLQLNYHAYLQVMAVLLTHMGYQDVRLCSRTGYVGRNRTGGADLLAYRPVPGGRRLVVVQAKQYASDRVIFRRTLDELRGVCLRLGAAEALLITTGTFSETVSPSGYASAQIAPVRLLDGDALLDLMDHYQVGVAWSTAAVPHKPAAMEVDEPFFAAKEAAFPGVARPLPGTRHLVGFVVSVTPRKRRS